MTDETTNETTTQDALAVPKGAKPATPKATRKAAPETTAPGSYDFRQSASGIVNAFRNGDNRAVYNAFKALGGLKAATVAGHAVAALSKGEVPSFVKVLEESV